RESFGRFARLQYLVSTNSGGEHAICTACFGEKGRCSGDGRHNEGRVPGAVRRVKKKMERRRAVLGGVSGVCHGAGHAWGTKPVVVEQPEFSLGDISFVFR